MQVRKPNPRTTCQQEVVPIPDIPPLHAQLCPHHCHAGIRTSKNIGIIERFANSPASGE